MSDNERDPEESRSLPSLVTDDDVNGDGATMYKYRDFSNVAEDELDQHSSPTTPPPSNSSRGNVESSIRVQKFPVKLYAILAQKEFQDIITWMPHGRSWKVLKPNLFESLVMPLFFEYSNYHSFNRLVNAWSFRRISSGPDRGSYYHELFLRGKPHLQKYMRRLPKTHKKLPMKKEDEPDFYGMDKASPLPSLDDAPLPPTAIMPQMRAQQQAALGGGMGLPAPMHAMSNQVMSPFKDAFDASRDPLMGLNRSGMSMGMHGMNGNMPGVAGMNGMNGMPGMNAIGGMNGMGAAMNGMGMSGLTGMNNMNSMNGINQLQAAGHQGMGGLDSAFGGQPGMDHQLQRLRQIQQMQLLDRQMGQTSSMGGLGNDTLARMQAESAISRLNRQQC